MFFNKSLKCVFIYKKDKIETRDEAKELLVEAKMPARCKQTQISRSLWVADALHRAGIRDVSANQHSRSPGVTSPALGFKSTDTITHIFAWRSFAWRSPTKVGGFKSTAL